jgi:hypothetical protein
MTTSMANWNTFTRFPYLPFEIRHLIWQEALSVPALWAVRSDPLAKFEFYPKQLDFPLTMTFIGPAPYLVGLFCREARKLMEASYIQFDSLKGGPSASHWVNMNKTVVFVGHGYDITAVLAAFGPGEVAQFKHIAWDQDRAYVPVPYIKRRKDVERSGSVHPLVENLLIGRIEDVAAHYARYTADSWLNRPKPCYYHCHEEPWPWFCAWRERL